MDLHAEKCQLGATEDDGLRENGKLDRLRAPSRVSAHPLDRRAPGQVRFEQCEKSKW